MAAIKADRIASAAEQNFKQALLFIKYGLEVVHKTLRMSELDPECNCVNSNNNDVKSKWKRRRELGKIAYSIEAVLLKSLTEIKTKLPESDDDMFIVLSKPKRPAVVGDVILYWCERVCVYEKVMDSTLWCYDTDDNGVSVCSATLGPDVSDARLIQAVASVDHVTVLSTCFRHDYVKFAFISGLTRRRIWSYGIREGKWYTLQFEFLPMYCDSPITGDGGLLCCLRPANLTQGIHDLELYVCNPLTQAWRKLPFPLRVQRFDLVHMVTDTETKQYTITTVSQHLSRQSGSSNTVTQVYNSATNTWNANSKGVFQSAGNNLVYYKKYVHGRFVGIRAYDQTTGYSTSIPFDIPFGWDEVDVDISSEEMVGISSAPCIVPVTVYQGLVYMLRNEEEEVKKNGVWVLRPPNHVWEKLYSVPDPDDLVFYLFSFIVCADMIAFFGEGDCDEEQPRKPYFWMLDRALETWIDMADQKVDHITWSQIVLEMRLDAVP